MDKGGKHIDVNNRERIEIDQPHGEGHQVQGHLANGRAVIQDGRMSHGGKPFHLTRARAGALHRADFTIAKSRLFEGVEDTGGITVKFNPEVLLMLINLQDSIR